MWYNNKTNELQKDKPYTGYLRQDLVAELYPNWIQVEDDFIIEETPASLEELKTKKRIELDALTGQKITGGFTMPIGDKIIKFDSDIETQITMQGIAVNAENEEFIKRYPEGVPIRGVAENKTEKEKFYLNGVGVLAFCVYLSEHIGQCKQRGWELQQAIDTAETVEELDKIKW